MADSTHSHFSLPSHGSPCSRFGSLRITEFLNLELETVTNHNIVPYSVRWCKLRQSILPQGLHGEPRTQHGSVRWGTTVLDVHVDLLCVSHNLRLLDGASRSIFLADFLRMKFAAPTSCRSQLVGAEEFVFSRRLEEIERLAPSRESTLFLSHILGPPHTAVWQQGEK